MVEVLIKLLNPIVTKIVVGKSVNTKIGICLFEKQKKKASLAASPEKSVSLLITSSVVYLSRENK